MKTCSASGDRTSGRTDGRQDASSVMKRGILPTAALPTHCCNAYSGNRPQARRPPSGQVFQLPPANSSSNAPPLQLNLTEESPGAKVAPVGCAVAPPISGLLSIEGIPVKGLVDTGASVTCLGFAIWWHYRAQWGALKPFTSPVHGACGKPLHIAGRTEHLDIQWAEARGRACFIVIVGLESPPCLIGMDIM